MKEELFCDERALLKHLEKESENMKEIRSSSVRNIYEIEDTLKKGRESMSQRSKGKLSEKILSSYQVKNTTESSIPIDFHDKKIHQLFEIKHIYKS